MARTDYGAIQSPVIQATSQAIRAVNGSSDLIAPRQWGANIRTMQSQSSYDNLLDQLVEETSQGAIASFSDGANNIQIPEITVNIDSSASECNITNATTPPTTDTAPYLFRQSGGDNNAYVGTEETDKLVGASAVVNQLIDAGEYRTGTYGGVVVTKEGNHLVANGSPANYAYIRLLTVGYTVPTVAGHIYMVNIPTNADLVYYDDSTVRQYQAKTAPFFFQGSGVNISPYCRANAGVTLTNAIISMQMFDLTAMFEKTIVDYVASLGITNGIAYLRKYGFFTKDYYPYTANTLQSVNTSKHTMVGKNQYTGDLSHTGVINDNGTRGTANSRLYTSPTKVLPNTSYAINVVGEKSGETIYINRVIEYGVNGVFIRRQTTASAIPYIYSNPSDCCYIVLDLRTSSLLDIESTDISEIQIELGSTATEYEPYTKHEYALPNIDLRGLYKLDASNNLYADGDTLEGDGTLTRKYGIVDLGTLNWIYDSEFQWLYTIGIALLVKRPTSTAIIGNGIMNPYVIVSRSTLGNVTVDKSYCINTNGTVFIRDSAYTSASTFKTAMSGVYLIYELATPTTETATGFTNPQIVDKFGTEEYTDERDFPLPVGHETVYLPTEQMDYNIPFGQTISSGELQIVSGEFDKIVSGGETIVLSSKTVIPTRLGDNNIYADTGDISVTYKANGTLYIGE